MLQTHRDGYDEVATLAQPAVRRNPPAVAADNLVAYRQTHAVTLKFTAGMQPLKRLEDAVHEALLKTDSIVSDPNLPPGSGRKGGDGQAMSFLRATELQGIREQVLE